MDEADILIAGGGIAGLTAAAVLAAGGWRVIVVDPGDPRDAAADTRTTAYLNPALALFAVAGLKEALAPHATPLDVLSVVDTAGWPPVERARRDFRAADLGQESFGWNLPNAVTRPLLAAAVDALGDVELRAGTAVRDMLVRDAEAIVSLSDGRRVAARLVIGADGRTSAVRAASGIDVAVTRYGQRALAFEVTHPEPHGNVSTEIYNRGGAFTLVPLRDIDGRPASAVVWMDDGARATARAGAGTEALGQEATLRSCGRLGPLTVASTVSSWPIVTQVADRLTAPRTALIAEAAHVMPPIGAQGLNTSLADVKALAASLGGDDAGAAAGLTAYERRRRGDIRARAHAIDVFNRVCRSGAPALQALRRFGLVAVHDMAPLRRGVMRAGLGG